MKKFVALSLPMVVATTLLTLALVLPAVASSPTPTYSFDLTGPQATKDPSTNHTFALTGAGSFDPSATTVVASGTFAILSSSGSPLSFGTWKATGLDSFCPRGGPNPGVQGGVLVITVTLFPHGGEPITGVTITVNCLVGTGCNPGAEGATITGSVGNFTDVVHGRTLFHLNP
jgi:hypothetical protein